jgi:hypothetical protein
MMAAEEKECLEAATPINTRYVTNWVLRIFKKWHADEPCMHVVIKLTQDQYRMNLDDKANWKNLMWNL